MGHQVPQRDGLAESRRDLKIKIPVYIRVDVQFALLRQLHDGNPSEKFGDGSQPKHRRFGINRFFFSKYRRSRSPSSTSPYRPSSLTRWRPRHRCAPIAAELCRRKMPPDPPSQERAGRRVELPTRASLRQAPPLSLVWGPLQSGAAWRALKIMRTSPPSTALREVEP